MPGERDETKRLPRLKIDKNKIFVSEEKDHFLFILENETLKNEVWTEELGLIGCAVTEKRILVFRKEKDVWKVVSCILEHTSDVFFISKKKIPCLLVATQKGEILFYEPCNKNTLSEWCLLYFINPLVSASIKLCFIQTKELLFIISTYTELCVNETKTKEGVQIHILGFEQGFSLLAKSVFFDSVFEIDTWLVSENQFVFSVKQIEKKHYYQATILNEKEICLSITETSVSDFKQKKPLHNAEGIC